MRAAPEKKGVATCARRSAALELHPRRDGAIDRRARQRGRPALARPHLPQGRRARRTCTRTPTGCAARCAASATAAGSGGVGWDEALDLVADGLAGAVSEHGDDARRRLPGQPQRAQPRLADPRHRAGASAAHPEPVLRHVGRPAPAPAAWPACSTATSSCCRSPTSTARRTSWCFGANPMASNGSLMTVPDFPQPAARAQGPRRADGRLDPRRTETAKVADEHHFVRPGSDAVRAAGDACSVLLAEGLTPPAAVRRRGRRACARPSSRFTPERAERRQRHARGRRPPPRARARRGRRRRPSTAGSASRRRRSASVCQWAVQLLNMLTGNLDRPGGAMFTTPAIDVVGARAASGRATSTCGAAGCAGCRSSAASCRCRRCAEEIETPGRGAGARAAHHRRQPGARRRPTAPRLDEALARPRLHGGGRHLRQRDHPARRRDPAADHARSSATTTTWSSTPWPCATPRGSPRRVFEPSRGRHARLGDLPRARRCALPRGWPTGCAPLREARCSPARPAAAQPARQLDRAAAALGRSRLTVRQARAHARGRRPRARCEPAGCPSGCRRQDQRIDLAPAAGARRPAAAATPSTAPRRHRASCCSSAGGTSATTTPGCTTPTRLTRGRPAPPAAHAPRRPGRARHRRRRPWSCGRLRVGAVEVEVQATDDVMPGVVSPAARLRPPAARACGWRTPRACPGCRSTTSPTPRVLDVAATPCSTACRCHRRRSAAWRTRPALRAPRGRRTASRAAIGSTARQRGLGGRPRRRPSTTVGQLGAHRPDGGRRPSTAT